MAEIDPVILQLRADVDRYTADLRRTTRLVEDQTRQQQRAFDRLGQGISGALAGVSVAALAREFIRLAEASKQIDAQLRLATQSFGTFGQAQADVARIAGEARGSLQATASLYGNFVRATEQLGGTQAQAARATETFSKALKIGGADANQAASATLQFGQALASGALRGDEFNSIAEASPRILRLVADALGVNQGAVRGLAAEGKLTSDVLFRALTDTKFTAGIDAEFKQIPVTVGDAMQQVENAAVTVFGAFDEGGQFTAALAGFVARGSQGFVDLASSARTEGENIRATFAGLSDVFNPLLAGAEGVFGSIRSQANYTRDAITNILGALDTVYNAYARANNIGTRLENAYTRGFNFVTGSNVRETPLLQQRDSAGTFNRGFTNSQSTIRRDSALREFEGKGFIVDRDRNGNVFLGADGKLDPAHYRRRPTSVAPPRVTAPKPAGSKARAKSSTSARGLTAADLASEINKDLAEAEQRVARLGSSEAEVSSRLQGLFRDTFGREGTDYADPFAGVSENDRAREVAFEARDDAEQRAQTVREDNVRSLADLYTDLFTQSTGDIFENFKRQGLRAVAIVLAQATVASFGNGGGGFGSLLKNIGAAASKQFGGGVPGRASGGFVGAGQLVRVNEGASPGRMEGFRPVGSGTVIPLGQMAKAQGGTTVVHQHFSLDARGGLLLPEFVAGIQGYVDGKASEAGRAAYSGAVRDVPANAAKERPLKG